MVPPIPHQAATTGQSLMTALFLTGEALLWEQGQTLPNRILLELWEVCCYCCLMARFAFY